MIGRWHDALVKLINNPTWSSQERELLTRYCQLMTAPGDHHDSTYPHRTRFTGTLRECILYYVGYWVGRFRELYKRWVAGGYSPRAWGLLCKPLEELERDTLPMIHATKDGNRYVLNLG
jgi:hypothetical protein